MPRSFCELSNLEASGSQKGTFHPVKFNRRHSFDYAGDQGVFKKIP